MAKKKFKKNVTSNFFVHRRAAKNFSRPENFFHRETRAKNSQNRPSENCLRFSGFSSFFFFGMARPIQTEFRGRKTERIFFFFFLAKDEKFYVKFREFFRRKTVEKVLAFGNYTRKYRANPLSILSPPERVEIVRPYWDCVLRKVSQTDMQKKINE